jgi:uncharacterized membrane protein
METRFEALLQSEDRHIEKLKELVFDAIKEEELLSEKLYEFEDKHPPFTSRLADKVASFGGSWKFIISFGLFMLVWMLVNVYLLTKPFDAFPFILLNLILSTLAAIQAPIIMMSQNRKEEKDRQRAVNDYLINLKAEIEIRTMHRKIDLLMAEQMRTLFDMQKVQVDLMEEMKAMMKEQPAK